MTMIALVLLTVCLSATCHAGTPPGYRYGEVWWQEYLPDEQTALLLHFGRPQPTPRQQLLKAIAQQAADDHIGEVVDPLLDPSVKPDDNPIDDANVPPGVVLDYSGARQSFTLEKGAAITPKGRFGAGLALDGAGGMKLEHIEHAGPVECWFKVEALPKAESCIYSLGKDEARLLLLPDGRLELRLRKPHGIPPKGLSPAMLQSIMARDATIVTDGPISIGEWHHVVVFDKPHVVQGAGSPFDATIKLDGFDVAHYLSENSNGYSFLGRGATSLMLGNNVAGEQPFIGIMDEVRVSYAFREFFERPAIPWRDATGQRALQFNKPFFRGDGTLFHAALDGLRYDIGSSGADDIIPNLKMGKIADLAIDGIRGKGWVLDPTIGFPHIPATKMSTQAGSLEFWLRPVNWDDLTGYWSHTPPNKKDLSILRFYGKDAQDGKTKQYLSVTLPRAYNLERSRVPMDPGHWLHCVITWGNRNDGKGSFFINGRYHTWVMYNSDELKRFTPQYLEFGVNDSIPVAHGEPPVIDIDEVVAYSYPLAPDEVEQAQTRWMSALQPIKLYRDSYSYKYSLSRLEFSLTPLLPEGVTPAACTVKLTDAAGKVVAGPVTATTLNEKAFHLLLRDGTPLPYGQYRFSFTIADAQGKPVLEGSRDWAYQEEAWRNYQGGILEHVPAPWTPIVAGQTSLSTRMTSYQFNTDGLRRRSARMASTYWPRHSNCWRMANRWRVGV